MRPQEVAAVHGVQSDAFALIAFDKAFLAQPVGDGVTTLGIPIGLAVIVFTILITVMYVRRANTEFDALNQQILKDAAQ